MCTQLSRGTIYVIICILFASHCPAILLAQQQDAVEIDESDIDFARQQLNQRIQEVIADVDECCELTDEQKEKFHISAKGVVAKQLRFFESIAKAIAKMPQSGDLDDDSIMMLLGEPENKPFWKKAVRSILTDGQLAKYQELQAERNTVLREKEVNRFVDKFARRLKLTDEQHQRVTELIDQNFGDRILEKAQHHKDCMIEAGPGFAAVMGDEVGEDLNLPTPITSEQLADFLNENQVKIWEKRVQPKLENLTSLRYFEGGMLALIVNINEKRGGFVVPRPPGN